MFSPSRVAQGGLVAAAAVFLTAISIVLAGSLQKPDERAGQPGRVADNFRLPNVQGKMVSLSSLRGNIAVICFAPAPTSEQAEQDVRRLTQLGRQYAANNDVKLLAIFSRTEELSPDDLRRLKDLAAEAGPRCLTLLDPTAGVAQRYQVADMPTFLVVDGAGVIRYRGDIDDTSAQAPLASASFGSMIDLLLAERPLPGQPAPAMLSNIK